MIDSIASTLYAMRRQEETGGYLVPEDFLNQQDDPAVEIPKTPLNVDADCRTKISSWCFQVADYAKFGRETVEISMNYLDRFLMTPEGRIAKLDREFYQRAALTCLYLAVKIHEPEAMAPKFVTKLSRDTFLPEEVVAMEACILGALRWRLNPPTSLSYVRSLLALIPGDVLSVDDDARHSAFDITKYQCELAVTEYSLVGVSACTIAYSALKNSLESLCVDEQVLDWVEHVLSQAAGMDEVVVHHSNVELVQQVLYEAVIRNPANEYTLDHPGGVSASSSSSGACSSKLHGKRAHFEESPRSVNVNTSRSPTSHNV